MESTSLSVHTLEKLGFETPWSRLVFKTGIEFLEYFFVRPAPPARSSPSRGVLAAEAGAATQVPCAELVQGRLFLKQAKL